MPAERIYLPVTAQQLSHLADTGQLDTRGATAFAVTEPLRRANPGLDAEDLEYAAFCDAVAAAGARLAGGEGRRVVASADADVAWLDASAGGGEDGEQAPSAPELSRIALTAEVPLRRIASFHIDEAPVSGDAVAEADDLLWYDVTELEDLRAELG